MTTQVDTEGTAETEAAEPAKRRRKLGPPPPPVLTVAERNYLATTLAVIAVLEKEVAARKADAKAIMGRQMRAGDTLVTCLDPDDPDPVENGTSLGTVIKPRAARNWKVVDPEKFTAWVEELFPTEVETIVQVRTSWRDRVLEECKTRGGFAHKATGGEVIIPPGVEVTVGSSTPRVNPSDEARALVMAALANGGAAAYLLDGGTPALPVGGA